MGASFGTDGRAIAWPELLNARDLGGLPAGAGATRFGAVVRSDSLSRLDGSGRPDLLAYGVGAIVDLRAPSELAMAPSPFRDHPGWRHLPVLDDVALQAIGQVNGREATYRWQLDTRGPQLAAAVAAIAEAPPGGVVVHCWVGKDRTGIVTALLLELAGVDRAAIVEDYALSGPALAPVLEERLRSEPDPDRRERLRRAYAAPPEAMAGLLAYLESRYGGAAAYLVANGVAEATLARLVARLL